MSGDAFPTLDQVTTTDSGLRSPSFILEIRLFIAPFLEKNQTRGTNPGNAHRNDFAFHK